MAVGKINPFMQNMQAIQSTGAIKAKNAQATGGNPAQSSSSINQKANTVGVNTNIGVGDVSYLPNQLGKSGKATTLAFA